MRGARARASATAGAFIFIAASAACSKEPPPTEHTGTSTQNLESFQPYNGYLGTSLPAKTLALTFDDGPGTFATQISSYLKGQGIRTIFFINGDRVTTSADLPNPNNIGVTPNVTTIMDQILADGNLIGNHTVTHRDMTTITAGDVFKEVNETDMDLMPYSRFVPSGFFLFRAPYGDTNPSVFSALSGTAMNKYVGPVYWDAGGVSTSYPNYAADWACWQGQITCAGTDVAAGCAGAGATTTLNPANPGYLTTTQCGDAYFKEITSVGRGVVLMHDPYSWAQGNTLDMVKYLVPKLQGAGFSFVRLDEVPDIRADLPPCDPSCATCNGTAATQCKTCTGGEYFSSGSCPACSTCNAGKYQAAACSTNADTVCAACDVSCATCSGPSASECTSCSANYYLSGGLCHSCSTCTAGNSVAAACTSTSDTSCTQCSAGTYSATPGSLTCTSCAAGSFAAAPGSTSCTACAPGSAADQTGQTACTTCIAGQHAAGGSTACSNCTAGTFAAAGSGTCTSCPVGTSSADGAASCTACAAGSFAGAGAATCAPCAAGKFAAGPGATSCTSCPAGTSAGTSGATVCAACAAGSYAAAGATSCTSCGSCDDNDACTTDACDATQGCTHTPHGGCMPKDAGAPIATDGGTKPGQDGGAPSGGDASVVDTDAPVGNSGGCALSASSSENTNGAVFFGLALAASAALRRRKRRCG